MDEKQQFEDLIGKSLLDTGGEKIGKIADIYVDETTDKPEWFAVSTGLFGSNISFVPMLEMHVEDDGDVVVPYPKSQVKDAPNCEENGALSQEEERQLYQHYGVQYQDEHNDSVLATAMQTTSSDAAKNLSAGVQLTTEVQEQRLRLRPYASTGATGRTDVQLDEEFKYDK